MEHRTSSPFLGPPCQNVFPACYNPHARAGILTTSRLQSCRLVPGLANRWKRVDPACLDPADPRPAIQAAPHPPPAIHLTHRSSQQGVSFTDVVEVIDETRTSLDPKGQTSISQFHLPHFPFPALHPWFRSPTCGRGCSRLSFFFISLWAAMSQSKTKGLHLSTAFTPQVSHRGGHFPPTRTRDHTSLAPCRNQLSDVAGLSAQSINYALITHPPEKKSFLNANVCWFSSKESLLLPGTMLLSKNIKDHLIISSGGGTRSANLWCVSLCWRKLGTSNGVINTHFNVKCCFKNVLRGNIRSDVECKTKLYSAT